MNQLKYYDARSKRALISNPLLVSIMVACAIIGALIGGTIRANHDQKAIDDAWDKVVVVADGQLIANPAYYALHPDALARTRTAKFIDKNRAAIDIAFSDEK